MKIIKRFNDGTALVQYAGKQPEIIKIEDIREDDLANKITLTSLDNDGFVIEGTDYQVTITPSSKMFIKITTEEQTHTGLLSGELLLKYLEYIKSEILTIQTHTNTSVK